MATAAPATELVRGTLFDGAIEAVAQASALADPVAIVAVLSIAYWLGDHDRGAFALGTAAFGLALVVAIKEALALPRPPATLHLVEAAGYGFPSGHAAGAVLVYGLLASQTDVGPAVARYGIAAAVALLVGLSRIAAGVHFLGDVLGGFLLGLAVLVGATRFARDRQRDLFLVAVLLSALAVLLSGGTYESALQLLGVGLGGALAWTALAPVPDAPTPATAAVGAVVLPVVVLLVSGADAALPLPLATTGALAVGIGLVIVTPALAARTVDAVRSARGAPAVE